LHQWKETTMTKPTKRHRAEDAEPWFAALAGMEALATTLEFSKWSDEDRAESIRRVNRLIRAVRHNPWTDKMPAAPRRRSFNAKEIRA